METMTNELTVIPRTIGMMTRMMDVINTEEIEDAVIVSEEEQEEHPNFIESNTSGITLEELEHCTQFWRQSAYNQPPDIHTPDRGGCKELFYG